MNTLNERKCMVASAHKNKQQDLHHHHHKRNKHSHPGQMFDIKPSTLLTFGAVISLQLLLMMTTMIVNDRQVEAGLVEIYNKYKPKITIEHSLNSSGSGIVSQIQDQYGNSISRSIEYNSPIKRIMELISQHAPVIVVSSNNNDNRAHMHPPAPHQQIVHQSGQSFIGMPRQHQQSAASNQLVAGPNFRNINNPSTFIASASPPPSSATDSTADQNNWALMETNPMVQSALVSTSDSQPQIISTGLPYEQRYQIQHVTDDNGNQITLQMPAGSLNFATNELSTNDGQQYQQLANFPDAQQSIFLQHQEQQQQQQQQPQPQAQQQQHLQTQDAQPIFLSSYVPEIQMGAPRGGESVQRAASPGAVILPEQQSPDSIQDIQGKDNEQAGKESEPSSSDEGDAEPSKPYRAPDESDNDIEEPRNANQAAESEEPNNNDSGSITYEDKYDSDKDEPRSSSSGSPSQSSSSGGGEGDPRAEASGAIVNGLISVGLNDDCLQCICRAASGCDELLGCITRGADEKYCGPYQLTEEYWNMAGSPGDASTNFSSYEDCANERDCAAETVINYMKKYYRDCDGDSNITCMDYARLHRLKPDECGDTEKLANSFDAYWAKFQRCAEGYNRSRTGDDESI